MMIGLGGTRRRSLLRPTSRRSWTTPKATNPWLTTTTCSTWRTWTMGLKRPTWPSRIASRRPWPRSRPRRRHSVVKPDGSRNRSSLDGTSTHHGPINKGPAARKGWELGKQPYNASAVVSERQKRPRPWRRRQKWLLPPSTFY